MERAMTSYLFVIAAALLVTQIDASSDDGPKNYLFEGGSFNITSQKEFAAALKKHPLLMVAFAAASCRHCVNFEPEYIAATNMLEEYKIPLARMDLDKFKDIAEDYRISSLPAIKFFRKGKASNYDGVHSAMALKMYGEKQSLPAVRDVGSKERLEGFKMAADLTVVGFFGDLDDEEEELKEFKDAAKQMWGRHNIYFGLVTKSPLISLAKQWKWIEKTPSAVLFQNFDINEEGTELVEPERHSVVLSELTDKLSDWIAKNSVQLVAEVNHLNFHYYEELRLPILMLFLNRSTAYDQRNNQQVLGEYKIAAAKFPGRISFVFADVTAFKDQRLSLGLLPHITPALAFNTLDLNLYPFPHTRELSARNIIDFARDYLAGDLKPKKKSADQTPPQVGEVVEVIGNTFDELVLNDNKDVMLLLYVKDDPDTETLMTYYKRVAERFKWRKADNLTIARMDLVENQLAIDVQISKVPAVLFFPANDKKPPYRMFHGKGKVRPLMLWAGEHAHYDLKFENDTPDLDKEQRKAYEEQLAELNERRRKEAEEKEKVEMMKEEWKKEEEERKAKEEKEEEEEAAAEKMEADTPSPPPASSPPVVQESTEQPAAEQPKKAEKKKPKPRVWADDDVEAPVPIRKPDEL